MARWWRAFLVWLCLCCLAPASAQTGEPEPGLVIHSYPPGAQVYEGLEYKGVAGTRIPLSFGNHALILKLEQHQDKPITIQGEDIRNGFYPPSGSVALPANSTRQAVLDFLTYRYWVLLVLGGAGMAARFVWRTMKRQEKELRVISTAAVAMQTEQRSLIMETIDGYRVVSMLGQGGMSEVYTAVPLPSLDLSAAVAVKVMNKELRERTESMDRFEREIQVSQKLAHPGIVEVKSSGWLGDRLYLVMELIEGKELRELLGGLRGDWSRIGDILSQLFLAVDFAHRQGVYHRDLKPENIMLTHEGKVKVMDFGLARAVDSKTLTKAGVAMGTPMYIAPESVRGSHDADDRADQYTLGVIAYEMIVGKVPFYSEEVFHLLYCHATEPPPPPSEVAGLPVAIDEVLLKMLSKKPRDRYRDVEEARVALLEAMKTLS